MSAFHYGMNLREFDTEFVRLGGTIQPLRRTGERQYRHPFMERAFRLNGRRKDAPRHAVKCGMRVEGLR